VRAASKASVEPGLDMHRLNGQSAAVASDAADHSAVRLADPVAEREEGSLPTDPRVKKSA